MKPRHSRSARTRTHTHTHTPFYKRRLGRRLALEPLEPRTLLSLGAVETKLIPSDLHAGEQFGTSVDISGQYAIAATPFAGGIIGAAYVFETATGTQLYKFTPSDLPSDTEIGFGWDVAVDGDIGIVGAPEANVAARDSGAAYVFDLTTGRQLFRLYADDGGVEDDFGVAVAISGSIAIVEAPYHAGSRGTAYVYDVSTGRLTSARTLLPSSSCTAIRTTQCRWDRVRNWPWH